MNIALFHFWPYFNSSGIDLSSRGAHYSRARRAFSEATPGLLCSKALGSQIGLPPLLLCAIVVSLQSCNKHLGRTRKR